MRARVRASGRQRVLVLALQRVLVLRPAMRPARALLLRRALVLRQALVWELRPT